MNPTASTAAARQRHIYDNNAEISEVQHLETLLLLALSPSRAGETLVYLSRLDLNEREALVRLADSHHVVVRGFTAIRDAALTAENPELERWAECILNAESRRIENALKHLYAITQELEANAGPTVVMKSLDHWPDLGNDLDLYTTAHENKVIHTMTQRFQAHVEARSWGDRLAKKWNFAVAGLRESVEVHVQRLGQTGEHIALAKRFAQRRVPALVDGYRFMVPATEERIVVAVLQRMYRHFYFRVCDIVNSAQLVESAAIDFSELRRASESAGIWPGVATYLRIVSGYLESYRGYGLELPQEVLAAASFGFDKLFPNRKFIRVPIMPHAAKLYARQLAQTAGRGDVPATFRLSLLPPLAGVAAVAFKITGSDKGIW